MEYIEIEGLGGEDYADRCHAPNLGWLSVTYPVEDAAEARAEIAARGWPASGPLFTADRPPFGRQSVTSIKTPDGATIEFVSESR